MTLSAVLFITALVFVDGKSAVTAHAAPLVSSHVARGASPNLYDRVSIAKRLLGRFSHLRFMGARALPAVVAPIAAYRTIRRVDFLNPGGVVDQGLPNGYVTGINNLAQISYSALSAASSAEPNVYPAYVIDDDGAHVMLSESVITPLEGPGLNDAHIEANALNDVGGVAGVYSYVFVRSDGSSGGFLGNLGWLAQSAAYPVSYFDGYDAGAQAYAMNNTNIAAGMTGQTNPKYVNQAAVFGKSIGRHPLLALQNPGCGNPTSGFAQANGINDAGEVVGYQISTKPGTPCEIVQAVRFVMNGYAQPLFPSQPLSSNYQSVAEAINQRGDIVGYIGASQLKAYLYKAACNCVTYIPRPSGENGGSAEAYAVNASDDVVGAYVDDKAATSTAFLATRGRTYDINSLLPKNSGWTITTAVGINDAREIIGYGYYQDPVSQQPVVAAFAMKP